MKVRFHAQGQDYKWRSVIAEVLDEKMFQECCIVRDNIAPIEYLTRWEDTGELTGPVRNFCVDWDCHQCSGRTDVRTGVITAHVEPQINCPDIFEIWFRLDSGPMIGRGNITFNDRSTAERFLEDLLKEKSDG